MKNLRDVYNIINLVPQSRIRETDLANDALMNNVQNTNNSNNNNNQLNSNNINITNLNSVINSNNTNLTNNIINRISSINTNDLTTSNANTINNHNLNNLVINRESSLNEFSNFNLNVYSEFAGNEQANNSDSGYLNRNFETHLDEIFDNLTYLITSEK